MAPINLALTFATDEELALEFGRRRRNNPKLGIVFTSASTGQVRVAPDALGFDLTTPAEVERALMREASAGRRVDVLLLVPSAFEKFVACMTSMAVFSESDGLRRATDEQVRAEFVRRVAGSGPTCKHGSPEGAFCQSCNLGLVSDKDMRAECIRCFPQGFGQVHETTIARAEDYQRECARLKELLADTETFKAHLEHPSEWTDDTLRSEYERRGLHRGIAFDAMERERDELKAKLNSAPQFRVLEHPSDWADADLRVEVSKRGLRMLSGFTDDMIRAEAERRKLVSVSGPDGLQWVRESNVRELDALRNDRDFLADRVARCEAERDEWKRRAEAAEAYVMRQPPPPIVVATSCLDPSLSKALSDPGTIIRVADTSPPRCQCRNGCGCSATPREASFLVNRGDGRIFVCDRCTLPGDENKRPLTNHQLLSDRPFEMPDVMRQPSAPRMTLVNPLPRLMLESGPGIEKLPEPKRDDTIDLATLADLVAADE